MEKRLQKLGIRCRVFLGWCISLILAYPEGLTCAHLHLRGIDEYSEITKYLQEKNEE